MNNSRIIAAAVLAIILGGCNNLRGTKLLMPENFGLTRVDQNIYIESGANEEDTSNLLDAMAKAEKQIHIAYGDVTSHPTVHACLTEECYASFGGLGSKAKVYGDHILLSPRGLNWHFLAHEWSHDEIRTRLTFGAWWRLPQWFDEGLAVTVSEAPDHSEAHWQFLIASKVQRPTRAELLTYTSLRQWLAAVHQYGETQNAKREAKGEPEIRPVYTAAGHEVRRWFAKVGNQGLLALIKRLNNGEDFETVYAASNRAN